ncbi:hypothetical protein HDV05_007382 [Chytridiales sp. JEL 0842]|nr:hypothetical protein HDV05_007382 [Chytridiales sp. JEL 0842]
MSSQQPPPTTLQRVLSPTTLQRIQRSRTKNLLLALVPLLTILIHSYPRSLPSILLYTLFVASPRVIFRKIRAYILGINLQNQSTYKNQAVVDQARRMNLPPALMDLKTAVFIESLRYTLSSQFENLVGLVKPLGLVHRKVAEWILGVRVIHFTNAGRSSKRLETTANLLEPKHAQSSTSQSESSLDKASTLEPKPDFEPVGPHIIPVEGHWIVQDTIHIPLTRLSEAESQDLVVLLYFHGGGYNTNSSITHSDHHALLVKGFNDKAKKEGKRKRLAVFSLEYPLAPGCVYPAQLKSAVEAYKWLIEDLRVKTIIIDSRLSTLTEPVFNPDGSQVLVHDYVNPSLAEFWMSNFRASVPVTDVRVSPILLPVDEMGLPTHGTLVIYGGSEMLVGMIREWVRKVKEGGGGGRLVVEEVEGMPHDFK